MGNRIVYLVWIAWMFMGFSQMDIDFLERKNTSSKNHGWSMGFNGLI